MGGFEVVLILVGLVAINLFNKASAAGHLITFPGRITSLSFDGVSATVLLQNTSNSDLTINSLAGNAYADSTLIGNISSFQPTMVPANGQVELPFTVRFMALNLVNEIINAIQSGSFNKPITIQGFVNGSGVQVPLDITYQLNV